MTTPLKKRLVKFSKKLVATLMLATLKRVTVSPKRMTELLWSFQGEDCQQALSVKKNPQKIKMKEIGLTGDNKVFINHSLCPYYHVL